MVEKAGRFFLVIACGVGPGDEVIMPAYTYTASASVVDHVGATIKMVDIRPSAGLNGSNGSNGFKIHENTSCHQATDLLPLLATEDEQGSLSRLLNIILT